MSIYAYFSRFLYISFTKFNYLKIKIFSKPMIFHYKQYYLIGNNKVNQYIYKYY